MTDTPQKVYALLLAGGNGERLWPLSRRARPKQLLSLEEQQSLLEEAVARVAPLVPQDNMWVVTTEQQLEYIAPVVHDTVGFIMTEPELKNTGAAILLNSFVIQAHDPAALVAVFPTDHYIPDAKKFHDFMVHVIDSARITQKIVILGLKPTYAATSYGYMEYDEKSKSVPYKVKRFVEKPSEARAQKFLASPYSLWNTGIFCAPVSVLIDEFEHHAPELFEAVKAYWLDGEPYSKVPSISIDYAVMKKSKKLSVLPAHLAWSDVGSLDTYLSLCSTQQETQLVEVDSQNNLVNVREKLVALIGIEDLCIIQVDDILLVAKRNETDKVKLVLDTLKQNNFDEYL